MLAVGLLAVSFAATPGTAAQVNGRGSSARQPVFSNVPSTITVHVNAASGAIVRYTAPTARDPAAGPVAVSCSPASGSTFDLGDTDVTCTAADKRGRRATASFLVRVLDTVPPPPPSDVLAQGTRTSVTLSWRLPASKDVAGTKIVRLPGDAVVYQGPAASFTDSEVTANATYHYLVATYDLAGNLSPVATATVSARVTPLTLPQNGASLTTAPLLRWQPTASTQYYNVQLWAVHGKSSIKILSVWPSTNHLQLTATWTYLGNSHALGKGTYRWYVWPGIGPLQAARYGNLLGTSEFTIVG